MGDQRERIYKYEQEIARLDELYIQLEGLWRYVPRYGLLALLAPPVWYFAGVGWAITELLVTAALVATQAYLIGVRKNENRWNRALVAQDLDKLREESMPPGSAL
jgi:hypothetical protein